MGLGALALEQTPAFPTYPRRMTVEEVASGLVLSYVSQAIAGKGGAVAVLLLIVFMSCTGTTSAQLIAMSSIFSFDIYSTYINKNPTNAQIIKWSHIGVVGSALLNSTLATAFYEGGVDIVWLLYFLGILICPGMFPTCFALAWKRRTKAAAIIAPLVGFAAGVTAWPTMRDITSISVPLLISIAISYIWPEPDFEWSKLLSIKRIDDDEHGQVGSKASHFNAETYFTPERVAYMKRMSRIAVFWAVATFVGQMALWPLPMYGARFIFGKKLFIAWVVVSLIWLWVTLFIANFYPLVDGGFKKIWQVLRWQTTPQSEQSTGSSTPEADSSPPGEEVLKGVVVNEKSAQA